MTKYGFEHLLWELAPQVLGATVRRYRDFAAAEDAVQEALLAAAVQWPQEGVPGNPRGWLMQVAARRMTDEIRSDVARREREAAAAALEAGYILPVPGLGARCRRRRHAGPYLHVLPSCFEHIFSDCADAARGGWFDNGRNCAGISCARSDDGTTH